MGSDRVHPDSALDTLVRELQEHGLDYPDMPNVLVDAILEQSQHQAPPSSPASPINPKTGHAILCGPSKINGLPD